MPDIEEIEAVMRSLQAAARSGDLLAVPSLAAQLEKAVMQLGEVSHEPARLQQLREQAAETAMLLEAVHRGVAAARSRFDEIIAVRNGAGTYGDDGQRRQLTIPARDSKRL